MEDLNPMVEDMDRENVKVVKNLLSPTSMTDYAPIGTLEPT